MDTKREKAEILMKKDAFFLCMKQPGETTVIYITLAFELDSVYVSVIRKFGVSRAYVRVVPPPGESEYLTVKFSIAVPSLVSEMGYRDQLIMQQSVSHKRRLLLGSININIIKRNMYV